MVFSIKPLKFNDPDLEKEFREDYYDKSIMAVRIALILGIILYGIFGVLDILIAPLSKTRILFIRFAVVIPGLFTVFIISFFNIFRKYMQPILMFITLVAGLGIVAMVGIAIEAETSLFYYAGLMLILMWAYTLVKLRFINAVIVCWTLWVCYEVITIMFQNIFADKRLLNIFINNNFFFISSNIIGMFAGYLIEFYIRKDFLQSKEIAEKREELQAERNELKYRIKIMDDELDMACIIQRRLIPVNAPDENIYSLYKPMKAIGGDFMDFIKFSDEKKTGIFICDVSGHGVPAALITSIIKSTIHESKNFYSDPSLMLLHLNQALSSLTEDIFVTAFYGIYDSENRSITYSNAGHHPPAVIQKTGITTLSGAKSIPLAFMENTGLIESELVYLNSTEMLPRDSKILFYTDGLIEARNPGLEERDFGIRFHERIMRLQNSSCKEFTESLYGELVEFRESESFNDDICIICLDII